MPIVSGNVYYTAVNANIPGVGIQNVPVVLFDSVGLLGAIALTDASGAFVFTNVPNGTYSVIEAWGAAGGLPTPVNYAISAVAMPVPPPEAEPPLSALSVIPPPTADYLQARSPNMLFITVSGLNIINLQFFDSPVADIPLILNGVNLIGSNLITAADNGTWGTNTPGTLANTRPALEPYPGVTPGFTYTTNLVPNDGFYTVLNTVNSGAIWNGIWFGTSDHTTRLETGRFIMVNGANPNNSIFTQPVAVTPNTNYSLTAWVMNLITAPGLALPKLGIRVLDQNGNVLIVQSVNPIPAQPIPTWFQNGFIFNSGANNSLTVQIISQGPLAEGNDYVIDDVEMFEVQFVNVLDFVKDIQPPIVYSETGVGASATVTVTVTNNTAQAISNVFFQDILDPYLLFTPNSVLVDGSNVGYLGANPNIGFSLGNMPANSMHVITFDVTTTGGPAIVPNTADISYDAVVSGSGDVIRATFPSNIANVEIVVNQAVVTIDKTGDKAFADVGDVITYTLTLKNIGNVPANAVTITDAVPNGTTFIAGSVTGGTGSLPTLTLLAPIPAGGTAVVTFQVLVGAVIPIPNPIFNSASADFTFTIDPALPNGGNGTAQSNIFTTLINSAIITTVKTVDKAFANVNDIITYTITVSNTGNVTANNVVITDALSAGVSFVPGSLVGATGIPPTFTLNTPVPAFGNVVVSYKVLVGAALPNPNPVLNSVSAAFDYTVDPNQPNGESGISYSNEVETQINTAKLVMTKSVDKAISYLGDTIAYSIAVKNTGNTQANNVVITDVIPNGTVLIPGSLTVNVPFITLPGGIIQLINPVAPDETIVIKFKVLVTAIPVPNPIINKANATFDYTVDPNNPNGASGTAKSNEVTTIVFRNNFAQQISDLIESVALEQEALAAIANAEGAKIQRIVAMQGITTQKLLCLNKSVAEMLDSISLLEAILKQKLSIVDCQISGESC